MKKVKHFLFPNVWKFLIICIDMGVLCQSKNQLQSMKLENKIEFDNENIMNDIRIQNELENLNHTTDQKEISRIKKRINYWKNRRKYLDRVKKWSELNQIKKSEMRQEWYQKNKNSCLERQKLWRKNNREKDLNRQKMYKKLNREKLRLYRNSNVNSKLARSLRSRLKHALKNNQKTGSAVSDLGCSISDFKQYLESKFQFGMNWENYGTFGWHIDHIKPLSSFDLTNRLQFLEACHFTNLQPLWASENRQKGGVRQKV